MSVQLHAYSFSSPRTLDEALTVLASDSSARPFAGGTDLMVLLEAGHLPPGHYVSLWELSGLRGVQEHDDRVAIGALSTYTDVRRSAVLTRDYPMLGEAASETGGVATQNRGTIGGNIANASPAADTPPALLAYDAELELQSRNGVRRVPYRQFHTAYKKMDLGRDEIIARILLPKRAAGWRDYYRKVGPRRAQAISKVCMAASIRAEGSIVADVRVSLGSVAPLVVRCAAAEAAIKGRTLDDRTIADAQSALTTDIAPIDDIRSTATYRLRVAQNLLREFLSGEYVSA
jgi:CO/xanthine dehydrogenase FAD-binding subunit